MISTNALRSQLGTQIRGKSSFSISFRISCASLRSVFCLRTRFLWIWVASPIHNSSCNSPSQRSNQRPYPLASIPTRACCPAGRQSTIEPLRLFAMRQPLLSQLSAIGVNQCDLLKLGVKINSYNDHCSAPFSRVPHDHRPVVTTHHEKWSNVSPRRKDRRGCKRLAPKSPFPS